MQSERNPPNIHSGYFMRPLSHWLAYFLHCTEMIDNYNRLNSDQKSIVDEVNHAILDKTEQIRLIVSGQGGYRSKCNNSHCICF